MYDFAHRVGESGLLLVLWRYRKKKGRGNTLVAYHNYLVSLPETQPRLPSCVLRI
ncbi:hypothetical protein FHS90_001718 [Rufibacter quisquiliarum]|uniref:Uncharacterized protein n=1 Tax=Rufibacter quisquiliarum TaxID=1549639 RepID=A0A839GEV7_9BACT|nr:hypothetical protein [Rufibacter quisquiliarum]